jgi:hypothetical protein
VSLRKEGAPTCFWEESARIRRTEVRPTRIRRDHAHERGEHAAINMVGVMLECVAENLATGRAVCFLKAPNQFVRRAQHLAGETN